MGQPSVKGPDLPFSIVDHSMIQYNKESIYIIGGTITQNGSKCSWTNQTWIVDPTNGFKIRKGPSLNIGSINHGCAKMSINGRTILVVAGGRNSNGYLDSVEILDPSTNNTWIPGL